MGIRVIQEGGRLFDIGLDTRYLQRIGKLDRLAYWEDLAQQVIEKYPQINE